MMSSDARIDVMVFDMVESTSGSWSAAKPGFDARRVQRGAPRSAAATELRRATSARTPRVHQPPRRDRDHVDAGLEQSHVVGHGGGVELRTARGVDHALGPRGEDGVDVVGRGETDRPDARELTRRRVPSFSGECTHTPTSSRSARRWVARIAMQPIQPVDQTATWCPASAAHERHRRGTCRRTVDERVGVSRRSAGGADHEPVDADVLVAGERLAVPLGVGLDVGVDRLVVGTSREKSSSTARGRRPLPSPRRSSRPARRATRCAEVRVVAASSGGPPIGIQPCAPRATRRRAELRVAADPDRDRLLGRSRPLDHVAGIEVAALIRERFAGPRERQDLECLVEQLVALVEVDTEREELGPVVAGTDPERAPAVGEEVEGRGGLREHERVVVRDDGQVREQAEPLGRGRGDGQRDERIECLVPAVREPVRARERGGR